MSSDEARAEAERRYAMEHGAGYSYPREAVVTMMRGAFEAGAEWQAERDAERITELEAEVEQWRRVAVEQTRLERDRAEAAEAKLAGVTPEMVEAGARGLTRHYLAEEGVYNPCEAQVTEHTVEPIRDIARAVLEAVYYRKQGTGG